MLVRIDVVVLITRRLWDMYAEIYSKVLTLCGISYITIRNHKVARSRNSKCLRIAFFNSVADQ